MKSNEANFIKRLQSKKEDALEYIIDCYLPLIKGIVHKVLGKSANEGMIEECINDIFLSIWDNSKKFHGDSTDFKKWICAIAKFKAIDYYRSSSKKNEFPFDYIELPNQQTVEGELIRLENNEELLAMIHQLAPIDQKIFIMKFLLGYTSEEIGRTLGITRTALDNRIYRGKKKLMKQVADFQVGGSFN
ncbi:MAG: sigma-70 family RNA polymerase sigma factor [Bacillaceae bacterium]